MGLLVVIVSTLFGCSEPDKSEDIIKAQRALAAGQLTQSQGILDPVLDEVPGDPTAATTRAHLHLLNGETDQADAVLLQIQSDDPKVQSEISLRRALVALEAKDFSKVKEMALKSTESFAYILAAEISLMDGEHDEAMGYLEKVTGSHSSLAKEYLRLLEGDEWSKSYAEAQALWAVRDYDLAIQSVAGTLEYVSNEAMENQFNEHVIIWSSRAIAVGQPEIAEQLLGLQGFKPDSDDWRVDTLKAMATCVKGDIASGLEMFKKLDGIAPVQGLHDAKATTVVVLSSIGEDGSALLNDLSGIFLSIFSRIVWLV